MIECFQREEQYKESKLFKSYFKRNLKYLPGGVQSGMNYVAEEKIHKRLFLIKGRGNVIASQECIKIILIKDFITD